MTTWRMRKLLLLIFCLLAGPLALATPDECELALKAKLRQQFLADSRFNWAQVPNLTRRPPDIFASKLAALSYPSIRQLPEGLEIQEKLFFQRVFELLRDNGQVYELLKDVESDVLKLAGSSEKVDRRRALEALLRTYEAQFGFRSTQISARLEVVDFLRVIANGFTFNDRAGNSIALALSPNLRAKPGRWIHGRQSHRLQWHLVLRHLLSHPEEFRGLDPLALYKRLGDRVLAQRLNWEQTGIAESAIGDQRTLYFQLFDSAENNGSSAGFYYEYREYWPDLPID